MSIKIIFFLFIFTIIICGEDYYKILGVKRNASKKDIRKAFKKLSLKYHTDKKKDNPEKAKQKFIKIAEAYEVLNDDEKRKIYDTYGSEGVKQHEQGQSAGPNMNMNNFQFNFNGKNFDGKSFEDIFSEFFGGKMGGGFKQGKRGKKGSFGGFSDFFGGFGDMFGNGNKKNFNNQQYYQKNNNRNFHGGFHEEETPNYFENSKVILVNMNILSKIYKRKKPWFILFFSPRDRNFKNFRNLFINLSKKIDPSIKIGAVNCDTDEEICEEFDIKKINEILFLSDNIKEKNIIYNGDLSVQKLKEFGEKYLINYVIKVTDKNYKNFINKNDSLFHVILFTEKTETPSIYRIISKNYNEKFVFGMVNKCDKELINKFNNVDKFPSLFLLIDDENYNGIFCNTELNKENIEEFLKQFLNRKKEKNLFPELTLNEYNENKHMIFILLTNSDNIKLEDKNLLIQLKKFYNKKIKFYYLNVKLYNKFWDSFDNEDKFMKGLILRGKKSKYIPIKRGKFNYNDLVNIIDNAIYDGTQFKNLINELSLKDKNFNGDL
jgi:DnaJ family protein C protein 16